jgi:lincosamide nucleotidyltransferase A/C/D/E
MDAHAGHVTRAHGDVEFWIDRSESDGLLQVLATRGFELLSTQPPEESFEFERDAQRFSTAFFDRISDGSSKPTGRWSDWRFPPGSFGEATCELGGTPVRVMSLEGLLAMKTQYPALQNGKPLRPKDVADIAILEALLSRGV